MVLIPTPTGEFAQKVKITPREPSYLVKPNHPIALLRAALTMTGDFTGRNVGIPTILTKVVARPKI